jgi:hypothetical protein
MSSRCTHSTARSGRPCSRVCSAAAGFLPYERPRPCVDRACGVPYTTARARKSWSQFDVDGQ